MQYLSMSDNKSTTTLMVLINIEPADTVNVNTKRAWFNPKINKTVQKKPSCEQSDLA